MEFIVIFMPNRLTECKKYVYKFKNRKMGRTKTLNFHVNIGKTCGSVYASNNHETN